MNSPKFTEQQGRLYEDEKEIKEWAWKQLRWRQEYPDGIFHWKGVYHWRRKNGSD